MVIKNFGGPVLDYYTCYKLKKKTSIATVGRLNFEYIFIKKYKVK